VRIDLHVHSSASDGTDPPSEVIRRAAAAGQDVVALTDHDTTAGWDEAAEAAEATALTLVPGMELSCLLSGRSVHLLCYLFDPDDEQLTRQTSLIRDDRVHRARQMVAKLNELGANVTWEQVTRISGDAVVGRPHVARAMAEAGVVETPADAFTPEWIADGGRAYVERYALDVARAITLVRAAGGVPVLAHPSSPGYEVSDEAIAQLATGGLAGIEVFHPDHDSTERARLTAVARRLGLLTTGGSDDHGSFNGSGIGAESTPREDYERLLSEAMAAPFPRGDDPARSRAHGGTGPPIPPGPSRDESE
jgi:predicted metal-dependent phosphoesterase TrpH